MVHSYECQRNHRKKNNCQGAELCYVTAGAWIILAVFLLILVLWCADRYTSIKITWCSCSVEKMVSSSTNELPSSASKIEEEIIGSPVEFTKKLTARANSKDEENDLNVEKPHDLAFEDELIGHQKTIVSPIDDDH